MICSLVSFFIRFINFFPESLVTYPLPLLLSFLSLNFASNARLFYRDRFVGHNNLSARQCLQGFSKEIQESAEKFIFFLLLFGFRYRELSESDSVHYHPPVNLRPSHLFM